MGLEAAAPVIILEFATSVKNDYFVIDTQHHVGPGEVVKGPKRQK